VSAPVRIIFSVFVVAILTLFGWRVSNGAWTPANWTMLAISATACLLVFIRFVYIFTFSYALAAVANGALLWAARPSAAAALVGGAAIVYGLRMAWFLWTRTRSRSYVTRADAAAAADREIGAAGKLGLWFMCTWLLTFHLMAVWLATQRAELTAGVIAGAALMLTGTLLEGVADWQKQDRKRRWPDRCVTTGLFARSRHPNYLGEMMMQAGLMTVAVASATSAGDVAAGAIAPLYIFILMIFEARRVDDHQIARYGEDPAYVDYRRRSGSLLPKI
jgi:steroid 5-alpha reductase family enzyme